MTVNAEPAAPSAPPETRKPRRMLWLWIGAFGFLGFVAAFCLLVLKPYLEVQHTVGRLNVDLDEAEVIDQLGGPRAAARKLGLYSRLPDRLAPDKPRALVLMGRCGSEAVPRLVELLKSKDRNLRMLAASSLGETGDQRAVEPLTTVALRDPDDDVRGCAIIWLGRLGGTRAVEVLIAALKDAPSSRLRDDAATALGFTLDQRAIPVLEELAASETDEEVLRSARWAIKNIRAAKGKGGP